MGGIGLVSLCLYYILNIKELWDIALAFGPLGVYGWLSGPLREVNKPDKV